MNNLFTKLAGLGLAATLFLASCEKEGDNITINQTAVPELKASTDKVDLRKNAAAETAVTYSWTPASYGFAAAPTYSLEFDAKGNNFKSPRVVTVGTATTYVMTVGDLNGVFTDLKQPLGTPSTLDVRVKSVLNATTGVAASAPTAVTGAPYESRELPKDTWAIIGSATPGSWDKDTPMTYDFDKKTWTVTLPLTAAEFKFRANGNWALNLGDAGTGDASSTGRELVYNVAPTPNPPNLAAPSAAGVYVITLDINAKPKPTYTIAKK